MSDFATWLTARDRKVAEAAWDACVASMKYESGEAVEIIASINPYRDPQPHNIGKDTA